jgi:uncharacterized repeat protein (TIGR01451 family)
MRTAALIMVVAFLTVPAVSSAQQKGGVVLMSTAEVEVVKIGEKGERLVTRVDADKANVLPGDTVIFTIAYSNGGSETVTDVSINNPVPDHMLYLDKSAEGAGTRIDFSADRGKSFTAADRLVLKGADGKERPAAAADISAVRWVLEKPLEKGGKGSVSFRAKVK